MNEILAKIYKSSGDKEYELLDEQPSNKKELYETFIKNKLWRLNNLYYIIDKEGDLVKFVMSDNQHKIHASLLRHTKIIVLKSRQLGISTYTMIRYFDDAIFRSNTKVGMINIDLKKGQALIDKLKLLWEHLNPTIKKDLKLTKTTDNKQSIAFSNNSSVSVKDDFRSETTHRLHISEFGVIAEKDPERMQDILTGTLQSLGAKNEAVIETTVKGNLDRFRNFWEDFSFLLKEGSTPSADDFLPVFLSFTDDKDCRSDIQQEETDELRKYCERLSEKGVTLDRQQKNWWVSKYRVLKDRIYQEYPAIVEDAFFAQTKAYFWRNLYFNSPTKDLEVPFNPQYPVYISFDLGLWDDFVIVFFQKIKGRIRIIRNYVNNTKGFSFYLETSLLLSKEFEYDIKGFFPPHDISLKDKMSGENRLSMLKRYCSLHFPESYIKVLPRNRVVDGIEAVSDKLIKDELFICSTNARYLINCLTNYAKKKDKATDKYKNEPRTSKFNHGSDAIRYVVQSFPYIEEHVLDTVSYHIIDQQINEEREENSLDDYHI